MTKVSIIIPSYNHGVYLQQRLESIAAQTYKDWETIIIDDKSSDDSAVIITEFLKNNPNFKVRHFIVNTTNSGSGYTSWKKGITLAETDYIWIAETDDYCEPEFLEQVMAVYEKEPETALVFTASSYVDSSGHFLYDTDNRMKTLGVNQNDFSVFQGNILTDKLPLNPYITNGSAVVFRNPKTIVPEAIFSLKQMSDLFLWTFLLQTGKFAFLNKKLNSFRRHETSTTTLTATKNKASLYSEYVSYINYFNCSEATVKNVINDYVANYVMTKNNAQGFFHITPIKKIKRLSKLRLQWLYLKSLVTFAFTKLNKKRNA